MQTKQQRQLLPLLLLLLSITITMTTALQIFMLLLLLQCFPIQFLILLSFFLIHFFFSYTLPPNMSYYQQYYDCDCYQVTSHTLYLAVSLPLKQRAFRVMTHMYLRGSSSSSSSSSSVQQNSVKGSIWHFKGVNRSRPPGTTLLASKPNVVSSDQF